MGLLSRAGVSGLSSVERRTPAVRVRAPVCIPRPRRTNNATCCGPERIRLSPDEATGRGFDSRLERPRSGSSVAEQLPDCTPKTAAADSEPRADAERLSGERPDDLREVARSSRARPTSKAGSSVLTAPHSHDRGHLIERRGVVSYLLQHTRRPTSRRRPSRVDERLRLNHRPFDGGAEVRVFVEDRSHASRGQVPSPATAPTP